MKLLKYLLTGVFFGVVLSKGQVVSWYRIYEMFKFESFHMFGVIGSAVILGIIGVALIKKKQLKDVDHHPIVPQKRRLKFWANLIGGTFFGLGWAMTGACPGPMFILLGNGFLVFGVVILAATFGAFIHGLLRSRLPH